MNALELVPPALKKFVDPAAPAAIRSMAAKGLAPIPPKDLVLVQCLLVGGEDAAIAEAADKSLRGHPEAILKPIVQADLPGPVFEVLAPRVVDKRALLEPLVLNKAVPDETLAAIVPQLPEEIVSILFQNEERLLRSRALVVALKDYPQASRASIDRMFDLLVRSGIIYEGVAEYSESILRLSNDERMAAVDKIDVPPDLLDPAFQPKASDDAPELEAVLDDDAPEGAQAPSESLQKRLMAMSMAQKVALALKGNRDVRNILLRDANRVIATAAIKNPRITEQEVAAIASSRSANEEVVRIVANTREWTRTYAIKLALVQNPKTPLSVAMRFLPLLNHMDLRSIAKSKNLPTAIANQAKAMMSRTGGG